MSKSYKKIVTGNANAKEISILHFIGKSDKNHYLKYKYLGNWQFTSILWSNQTKNITLNANNKHRITLNLCYGCTGQKHYLKCKY